MANVYASSGNGYILRNLIGGLGGQSSCIRGRRAASDIARNINPFASLGFLISSHNVETSLKTLPPSCFEGSPCTASPPI